MNNKLKIAGVVDESVVDGSGIRLTVFTQGCPHACVGCHNMHTWDSNGGYEIDIEDIKAKMLDNPLLSGITLSGGEPFEQWHKLIDLCKWVHENGMNVWCYSGYTLEQLTSGKYQCGQLLNYIDVLIDGRFEQDKLNLMLKFRGSSNQRIIDINKTRATNFTKIIEID